MSGHRSRSGGVRTWGSKKDPWGGYYTSEFFFCVSVICLSVVPLHLAITAKWLSGLTTSRAAGWMEVMEVGVLAEILNLVGFQGSTESFAGVRQIRVIRVAGGDIWLSLSDS